MAVLLVVLMLVIVAAGTVTPTAADAPQQRPPTVVLPTPVVTRTPPRVSPVAPAAPVRVAATPTKAAVAPAPRKPGAIGPSTTDSSSFTVQNIDSTNAQVTVTFVDESGTTYSPATLNASKPNPFTLTPGESFMVYPPAITTGLPSGRYSVVVSSTAQVAASSDLLGASTSLNFNGSFYGLSTGATPFYLPSILYNYYGWYDIISVQNVGDNTTDVTVTINCQEGGAPTATLTKTGLAKWASVHFDLYATPPSQWTTSSSCSGSAVITTSGQPVVAVNNERVPTSGNTQSFDGVASGGTKLYAPIVLTNYYGWNSSLNIRKIAAGNTTVTITYSDGGSSTCALTDATPGCLRYMPTYHPTAGQYAVTITSSNTSVPIIGVVNAANGTQASSYNMATGGTGTAAIPSVMNMFYGWFTSVTCQNVGTVDTTLNIAYSGKTAYNTSNLTAGTGFWEKNQMTESILQSGYQGGLTVTANTTGAQIACIVSSNQPANMAANTGDWSTSNNAFNK